MGFPASPGPKNLISSRESLRESQPVNLQRITLVLRPENGDRHPALDVFPGIGASRGAGSQSPFSSSVRQPSVNRCRSQVQSGLGTVNYGGRFENPRIEKFQEARARVKLDRNGGAPWVGGRRSFRKAACQVQSGPERSGFTGHKGTGPVGSRRVRRAIPIDTSARPVSPTGRASSAFGRLGLSGVLIGAGLCSRFFDLLGVIADGPGRRPSLLDRLPARSPENPLPRGDDRRGQGRDFARQQHPSRGRLEPRDPTSWPPASSGRGRCPTILSIGHAIREASDRPASVSPYVGW